MATAPNVLVNIGHSVYRFLRSYQYDAAVLNGTILQQFAQLTILPAYPTDLTKIRGPELAVGVASDITSTGAYYGELQQDQMVLLDLYGFVAGQGADHSNALYLSRLMDNVHWLFDTIARHDGFPLIDQSTASEIGQLEVDLVRTRKIPETVPAVEADRFKFITELEIAVTVSA